MKKIIYMCKEEIRSKKKMLLILITLIVLLSVSVQFTKENEQRSLLVLAIADILEKLLIPFFIYIGYRNYNKSFRNAIQINQKRSDYLISRSLTIIVVSVIVAIITTPLSYYFSDLGKFDSGEFIMPVFLGIYEPTIPMIFGFENIIFVTIITALVYIFVSHLSLFVTVLYHKLGITKCIISLVLIIMTLTSISYIFRYFNQDKDLLNSILGFNGIRINFIFPIFTLILSTIIIFTSTWILNSRTEV